MTGEFSPSEAAARIGATTRSVQRWIAKGALPARRVGGRWRVASDALDAYLAEGGRTDQRPARSSTTPGAPTHLLSPLFVANRGEIASRVRATAERLGIQTIVPGEGDVPGVDLLDVTAVVEAARAARAQAIHPGYGFLAESATCADAVEAAGIAWVGPPADAIRALGDKAGARRLAAGLDIPIVLGYDGPDQSDAALRIAADRIGLPLLVKPAAGGGGKGMRVVRDAAHLADALASARREALVAFGDDRVILERYLEGPRHIEIQVLFDAHGAGVHLGERDCSLQRRHQKVLEETPAPGLDPALRAQMTAAAIRLGSAVGYRNAGTCEFLVDDRGRCYFLEMNTRLQVEHPVTEAVTGRDLVADQLAIAGGATLASLGLEQAVIDRALADSGHAIEVRLYAEDAEDGFLPATGRIDLVRWPAAATRFVPAARDGPSGIRVDAGIGAGTDVGPRFDPMLAKVIAHGRDRAEAIERLAVALDETAVLGVVTNLRFLRWLVRAPFVRDALIRTDTLERVWPPDTWAAETAVPGDAWTAAARLLAVTGTAGSDRLAGGAYDGGWRINGPGRLRIATVDEERSVALSPDEVAGPDPFAWVRSGAAVLLDLGGRSTEFRLASPPDIEQAVRAAGHGATGTRQVVAPMPGNVLAVHVGPGDLVTAGDPVATLEAMKMEHVVGAPGAGRIDDVLVRPADQVVRGQLLATIEP